MAPSGNPAKARKSASVKTGNPRPVVPAIPLPYVKRQAAARAAATAQITTGTLTPDAATDAAAPSIEQANGNVSNAESTEASKPADVNQLSASGTETERANAEDADVMPNPETTQLENNHTDDSTSTFDSTNTATDSPNSSAPAAASDDVKHMDSRQDSPTPASNTQNQIPSSVSGGSMHSANQTPAGPASGSSHFAAKERRARPPAPHEPARYQMPPPFLPANRPPPGMTVNSDMNRLPRQPMPSGPPMHHSHPSNGSAVQFGVYHGSANSSPAPHSGGIAPPPGMPLNDGRAPYMGPPGNGYPPIMPMGSDLVPVTHYDGYARQTMAYAPQEPFQPYPNAFGPSTPHSLHGSQSSGHPDESATYNPYQPGHSRNGPNGFSQDFQAQGAKDRMMMTQDYPRMHAHPGHQHHLSVQEDNSEGLLDYLRQQSGNPELSDSVTELRYSDNHAAPVRVPGHRLIFARSSVLRDISRRQSPEQPLLVIETDNKWVRSDAFYMAVQRLYGLPLLPVPPPVNSMNSGEFSEAGSAEERFDFALAYAAAGKLLEWDPVLHRGCEIAAHLLDWQTLEKALEFALEGFVDNGTYESYKYEIGSKILLHGIANFVINNLPPTFSLDATVQESATYSRLPINPGVKPNEPLEQPTPVIVRSAQSSQTGKGHRHQLSNIQFGDLSLLDGANGSASDTPKASQQARPISHATLSRVLLSVPFGFLQMILDPPGPMRANAEARRRIVQEVVTEREARRNRIIDAVLDGRVRDSYPILQQLRAPEPRNLDRWGVLGWQEEVLSHSNGDGPSLARRWAPQRDGHSVPVAEFP